MLLQFDEPTNLANKRVKKMWLAKIMKP